jgi:hemerythrin-like domain-containing protein
MSAIEILVDEHGLISRMVIVLTVLQKDLERSGHANINAKVLADVADFFRVFVDENHHAKEEKVLSPCSNGTALAYRDARFRVLGVSTRKVESL